MAMCLYEYDEEKHMEMERREHYERGLADGIAQGELAGEKRGKREGKREEAIRGMQILVKQCWRLNQSNETITQILMDEYSISEQEAKRCIQEVLNYSVNQA
ncbi:MAG: hypothetical protein J5988_09135 [Eubacterium sp.]|nr:hypothetical protein [Eubacterium sp.]